VATGERLAVWVNDLDKGAPNRLIGSVVRVDGVCEPVLNSRNRRLGVHLLVPSGEYIRMVKAAPHNPFNLPARPLARVLLPNSRNSQQTVALVKTSGVVTYKDARLLFVQEDGEGLRVYPRTEANVETGDRVEVVGFAEPDGYSPKLVQAMVLKVGRGALPAALPIDLSQNEASGLDATRGQIEAIFLGASRRESVSVLDLEDTRTEGHFSAFIPAGRNELPHIPAGSRIRLEGVFKAEAGALPDLEKPLSAFQMYANSPADITVLRRPSWWTPRHSLFVLGGVALVLLFALAWVGLLRGQVQQRTGELDQEIAEHQRTEGALLTSERFLHSLVESLPQNILRKDLEGRFTFANGFFCRTLGKSMDQVIGKTDADLFPPGLAAKYRRDDQQVLQSGKFFETIEENRTHSGEKSFVQVIKTPLYGLENRLTGLQVVFWDVTERKLAEERLEATHRELVEASRLAGMAEVATGVLHNVGNVLNSVNISATLVSENLQRSKVASLAKVAALLHEHEADLANFFTRDPRGKQLTSYLGQLAEHLLAEQTGAAKELNELARNIEHIKDIVAMQQNYAKFVGVVETVKVTELVEDALRLNAGALARHDIQIVRDYAPNVPEITVERHKVLQILINLIRNAKYACEEEGQAGKRLTLRLRHDNRRVRIEVADNGVGIAPENITRVFNHGFTTRKDGHGFGLHSGSLAAKEMGGDLLAQSGGPGRGATFILELPLKKDSSQKA
jgi:PAS domain S-box-containing protein